MALENVGYFFGFWFFFQVNWCYNCQSTDDDDLADDDLAERHLFSEGSIPHQGSWCWDLGAVSKEAYEYVSEEKKKYKEKKNVTPNHWKVIVVK